MLRNLSLDLSGTSFVSVLKKILGFGLFFGKFFTFPNAVPKGYSNLFNTPLRGTGFVLPDDFIPSLPLKKIEPPIYV